MRLPIASAPLTPEEVREAVNRWSRTGWLRVRSLGDKITIQEVAARGCHAVRLTSQYERRRVARVHIPYDGGPIDDVGRPPSFWQLAVQPPRDFEDRTEHVPIPHTETLGVCPECEGDGEVTCPTCHGRGNVTCTWCNGRGYRERQQYDPGHAGPVGMPSMSGPSMGGTATGGGWVTMRDACTCRNGQVHCTACGGRGHQTCSGCAGGGRVRFYQQMTVTFHVADADEAVGEAGLPQRLILQAEGEVLIDQTAPRVETHDSLGAEVDVRLAELLRESHDAVGPEQRLLFQRLRVEAVPVYEVTYTYHGGAVRRLWVYGRERRVHPPKAPWRWMLLTGLIVGGVLLAAAVAGVVWAGMSFF